MSASRSIQLVRKSIDSMVSAIELYNKPDFKYREEIFCITAINAWELLLKAKLLKDNNNDLKIIYVREYLNNKDGSKGKKWKYKENRAGNKVTIDIIRALKKLLSKGDIDPICYENIVTLIEFRDNAIHFFNEDVLLAQKIQEIGAATLKSYLTLVQDWFSISLGKYNFYLMPLSFFHTDKISATLLGPRDLAASNLLNFIAKKEQLYPSTPSSPHNITITIETKIVKAGALDAHSIKVSSDPNAPEFKISMEDIRKTHPLDYKELTEKLRLRYQNFKVNDKYYELKKILEQDPSFCYHYPLNPNKPSGASMKMYSIKVFTEFDKHYSLKDET